MPSWDPAGLDQRGTLQSHESRRSPKKGLNNRFRIAIAATEQKDPESQEIGENKRNREISFYIFCFGSNFVLLAYFSPLLGISRLFSSVGG